jgi:hypothetical protein
MNASIKFGCSCGCSPCTCAPPPDPCNDFCVPRPCFFPGQLVTSDDLNAVVDYVRARDRMIAKLALGWGVLGGMRLLAAGTSSYQPFFEVDLPTEPLAPELRPVYPNPQVVPGTVIQVSAGAALDNQGRSLSLCAPRTIDILELSKGLGAVQATGTCADWFGIDFCTYVDLEVMTAAEFWVIAEYGETPARPIPSLAGGGACEPEPSCNFSRKLEDVRIRLVRDLPLLYFLHGCLVNPNVPGLEAFFASLFDGDANGGGGGGGGGAPSEPTSANEAMRGLFSCLGFKLTPQLYDYVNRIALTTCCTQSAVVLGRVLLVTQSDLFQQKLGDATHYVVIDDGFPYRRTVPNLTTIQLLRSTIPSASEQCENFPISPIPPPA